MSGTDTATVSFARAIGTLGAGITTGLMLSVPLWQIPASFKVDTLAPRDRLHLWSRSFDLAKSTMQTLIPLSSLSLAIAAALSAPPALYLPTNFIMRNRRSTLSLSAILLFSSIPFTYLMIIPRVENLKRIERAIVKDPENGNGGAETDTLIQEWTQLHLARVGLSLLSFTLALSELICA